MLISSYLENITFFFGEWKKKRKYGAWRDTSCVVGECQKADNNDGSSRYTVALSLNKIERENSTNNKRNRERGSEFAETFSTSVPSSHIFLLPFFSGGFAESYTNALYY